MLKSYNAVDTSAGRCVGGSRLRDSSVCRRRPRYEHATLLLTSSLAFSRWGDVFGEQVTAAAMIDRILHHAEVITFEGASYRLKDIGIATLPSARADNQQQSDD